MQDLIEAVRHVREIAEKYPDVINCSFDTFREMSIHLSGSTEYKPVLDGEITPYTEDYNKQSIVVDGVEIFRLIPKDVSHVS